MPVLIDEFEVVVEEETAPTDAAESAAGGGGNPDEQAPKPREVAAVVRHYHERTLRVRAH